MTRMPRNFHQLLLFALLILSIGVTWIRPIAAGELYGDLLEAELDQLREKGEYSKAVTMAEKALEQVEKKNGPKHLQVAEALLGLANQYSYLGASDKQIPLLERATAIFDQAPKEHAKTLVNCLRSLAFAYQQQKRFAETVKTFERESAIRKDSGIEGKELEEYLKRAKEEMEDEKARKNFTPLLIHGTKTLVIPGEIAQVVANPKQEAQKLVVKGGRIVHEEEGGKAIMLMHQGVQYAFLTLDLQKMIHSGHEVKEGDRTLSFVFENDAVRKAFLEQHKLTKTIKLHHNFDKVDFDLFVADDATYVRAVVRMSGFACCTLECKDFNKKFKQEGVCPTCGKRLVHSGWME